MTKIFKINSTRANKSEINPIMAVALTGSNRSVKYKKDILYYIIVKCL